MKQNEIIYGQLLALRLQIDSIIATLENTLEIEKEEQQCNHPEQYRFSLNTMGDDREKWKCKKCGKKFIDGIEVENIYE